MMMMSPSCQLLTLMVVVMVMLVGVSQARKNKEKNQHPRNITHCDSGASDMGSFDWNAYAGRWYVSRISAPLGQSLKDVQGYAVEIEASSIEPNARDKAWRGVTVERKEILVNGDGRKCRKRNWHCVREQGSSQTVCRLNGDGVGVITQKSVVMATDYITTAAVYRETYVNNRFLTKQINIMVRNPQADPDPSVVEQALQDYCGMYAADINSEFYKSISTSGGDLSCFLP